MLLSNPCGVSAPSNGLCGAINPPRRRAFVRIRSSGSDVAISLASGGGGDAVPRKPPVLSRAPPPRSHNVKDEELVPGKIFKGSVRAIMPYGAFVNLDARFDGLLHISKMSDRFVQNVGDVLTIGQEIEVVIESVDLSKRRIQLKRHLPQENNGSSSGTSRAAPARSPAAAKNGVPGTLPVATNENLAPSRASPVTGKEVARTGGAPAAVRTSSHTGTISSGSSSQLPGERTESSSTGEAETSSSSGKSPGRTRDLPVKTSYKKDQVVTGVVKNYTRRGCFVQLPGNQEGFLHANEIERDASRQGEPVPIENLVKVGQELKLKVLRVIEGRINLTMREEVDLTKINQELSDNGAGATNPFELAFRKNAVIRNYLRESGKLVEETPREES